MQGPGNEDKNALWKLQKPHTVRKSFDWNSDFGVACGGVTIPRGKVPEMVPEVKQLEE